ncbi:P-type E1-E2 ATPase/heavy metal translocating P-type ATPase [Roseiarcus fermentans]|uniref:P-type E1-E2 ATPase/heavy metal translocating P-type ATPase n=1 Tax=Roseiarcus fermentans TaxID=1473586 RepID=A0A366FRG8_9HYPH|nr:HAD-IC family P-type ATPase [Roseiarcus fermentans]RBP17252.1 P-type E1-E2 ATPase/heavy metal translocating P-type ATPase [Roseiarcus fermentans]
MQRFLAVSDQSARQPLVAGGVTACLLLAPVAPPLVLAAPALATFGVIPSLESAIADLRDRGRLSEDAADVVIDSLVILAQTFWAIPLAMILVWVRKRLLLAVKDHARQDVSRYFRAGAKRVWVLVDGVEVETPIGSLRRDDRVIVHAGETFPADGVVIDGTGLVDQRTMTGEERPADLFEGQPALARTQLIAGRVTVRVTRAGDETVAGQVVALLERTTEYRLTIDTKAEEKNERTVPYRLGAAIAALPFLGPYGAAGLLNLAHPGAWEIIYAPIGMLHLLSSCAREGILITDGRTLEILPGVDTIVFDKTGTLTDQIPLVESVRCVAGVSEREVLQWAAAVEQRLSHPIARAICAEAARRGVARAGAAALEYTISNGAQADVEGAPVIVGSARYMSAMGVDLSRSPSSSEGGSPDGVVVHVARAGRHVGSIVVRPRIRPEAAAVVSALRARGIAVRILSGDGRAQTARVARELGVDGFDAEVLPSGKSEVIRRLQARGRRVCFVGDGVNDLVALRQANVSIAVADAAAAAQAVASVVLVEHDLRRVLDLLEATDRFRERSGAALAVTAPIAIGAAAGVLFGNFGFFASVLANQAQVLSGVAVMARKWPLRSDPSSLISR